MSILIVGRDRETEELVGYVSRHCDGPLGLREIMGDSPYPINKDSLLQVIGEGGPGIQNSTRKEIRS